MHEMTSDLGTTAGYIVSFVVIRSGDYYMFEDDSDDDDIISSENAFAPEDAKASTDTLGEDEPRLGPLQVGGSLPT